MGCCSGSPSHRRSFFCLRLTPPEGRLRRVVFEGARSEHKWTLKDLNPELPSDWSAFEYLVLEFRHSSPQRFYLFVYDKGGPRRVVMQPYGQGVWVRAAVPLKYFQRRDYGNQMAAVNNRGTNSFWMSVWGPFGSISAVEALGVTMEYPLHKPVLEIRSVRLSREDPGSEILEKLPVVDEFGQWVHADWPRKIRSLEQLKKEWAEEEKTLKPGDFDYCKYGGYLKTKARATGFFRVEKIDGKWWFVDPDGHLFLSTNVFGLSLGFPSPTENRKAYFAALPPADLLGTFSIPGLSSSNNGAVSCLEPAAAVRRRLAREGRRHGDPAHGSLGPDNRSRSRVHCVWRRGPGVEAQETVPELPARASSTRTLRSWDCPMCTRSSLPARLTKRPPHNVPHARTIPTSWDTLSATSRRGRGGNPSWST